MSPADSNGLAGSKAERSNASLSARASEASSLRLELPCVRSSSCEGAGYLLRLSSEPTKLSHTASAVRVPLRLLDRPNLRSSSLQPSTTRLSSATHSYTLVLYTRTPDRPQGKDERGAHGSRSASPASWHPPRDGGCGAAALSVGAAEWRIGAIQVVDCSRCVRLSLAPQRNRPSPRQTRRHGRVSGHS